MPNFNNMLEAEYKKCKDIKGLCKDAAKFAKSIHYFRYDLRQSLDALEEMVLEEKTSDSAIKANSIDDYKKDRGIAPVLKAVLWNLDKWKKARAELVKLQNKPGLKPANVEKIKNIKADLVKLKKRTKLDKDLLKLEKQIDIDLQEFDNYLKVLKEYPAVHVMPDMEYKKRTDYILKAKPRLSSKQKKYNDVISNQLTERDLKKKGKDFDGMLKEIIKQAGLAVKAAEANEFYDVGPPWSTGLKEFQKLNMLIKSYTDIQSKFKDQIKKSDNKKMILKYFGEFEDTGEEAQKIWDAAQEKITKLGDEASRKAKIEAAKNPPASGKDAAKAKKAQKDVQKAVKTVESGK